jgi:hypothetical protein
MPPDLRGNPDIQTVGQIEDAEGRLVTLVRADCLPGPQADPLIETPAICFGRLTGELTFEFIVSLRPEAAAALASVLRDRDSQDVSIRNDATARASSGFEGQRELEARPVGPVLIPKTPHRLSDVAHLVGLMETFGGDWMLLVRGTDGSVSIAEGEFGAHLSLAATEALADVLQEFAQAHGASSSPGSG